MIFKKIFPLQKIYLLHIISKYLRCSQRSLKFLEVIICLFEYIPRVDPKYGHLRNLCLVVKFLRVLL